MIKRTIYSTIISLFSLCGINAQNVFEVAIVSDAAKNESHFFEEAIKSEITALLASQHQLNFTEIYTSGDIKNISDEIAKIYAQNQVDVLIGAGIVSSKILANQNSFSIPTIASVQLLKNVDDKEASDNFVSGISNYTFINSPFNIKEGINTLKEICGCDNLVVLTNDNLSSIGLSGEEIYFETDTHIKWLNFKSDLKSTVANISDDVDGVYILSPLSSYTSNEIEEFFEQLNERKLPSFTLLDSPMLEQGAYASFVASDNIKKIPRRIARNVEQIAEGENPKDFPVNIETFTNQLVVNMETVNKIGLYPKWTLLDNALLININKPNTTQVLNLKSAIAEGLQNNLGYQIQTKETQISAKDVSLAKSNYLPQLEMESTGFFLDENSVNSSFGSRGDFNWTAGASFSQLILSEPVLANIAIQKLLFESQQQAQNESELDVILEVAQRYFNYMQVLSIAELQNDNIKAVNQNLTIATNKEKVGYSGASDVYRWQTELDLAKTDLYETNAQLKAAGYQLNETLNRPIGEVFTIEESENINQLIEELDDFFVNLIQDQTTLNQLSGFMVNEALQNLPEIQQIELAIAAQERSLKSNKRSFYLPTIAFGAGLDYTIETVNPGEPPPIPDFEVNNDPTWNAAFTASIPLFAGGSRKYEKEKTEVGLYQLQDQRKEVKNLLELQVRANMELVNASYNNIRLTQSAAEAAEKNIAIVRDLYKSGQVDIITLVDAQNALLGAQINATNSIYQFMIDYFSLQRSTGNYTFLVTEAQRAQFLQRFLNFKTN
ncbi:MAG: TolC family protein [Bacteroidetes bacterium]|nr:TolC family protein [Bacteroidota bacterium]